MIHDVDDSLRKLVLRDAVNGSGVEISFEAPTKDWAARRNAPTINVYLYDVREDIERREVEFEEIRDEKRRVIERKPPARRFKLSYLVTAWTQRPEDEHRLLSAVLGCFLRHDALPDDVLSGVLADQPLAVIATIALPPSEDRNLSDIWSALGGELKPSLDLVVSAPFETGRAEKAAPLVVEEPRITVVSPASSERAGGKKKRRQHAVEREPRELPEETVVGGTERRPGRIVRIREIPRP